MGMSNSTQRLNQNANTCPKYVHQKEKEKEKETTFLSQSVFPCGPKNVKSLYFMLGIRDALQLAINLLMFLQEEERRDGMRTQANETRDPATESPSQAFLAGDITQETQNRKPSALRRRSTHHPGLDHIDRTADSCCHESSQERRGEMRQEVIRHADSIDTKTLEAIVGRQLRGRHQHGAGGVGPHAAE